MKLRLLFPTLCTMMLVLVACEKNNPNDPNLQKLPKGAFSVTSDKYVIFAPGNLQYQASTNTWRFAEHQYDVIGLNNENISNTYNGWIDLFGWGTGNKPTESSGGYDAYATYVDWGKNKIGEDAANTWRAPRIKDWWFIFYGRKNAAKLFGFCSINGINGIIILPDEWKTPKDVTFTPSTNCKLEDKGDYYWNNDGDNYSHNTYTTSEWDKMEAAGAVFLPASGIRSTKKVSDFGINGQYWTSTSDQYSVDVRCAFFSNYSISPEGSSTRDKGLSVRLVKDIKSE